MMNNPPTPYTMNNPPPLTLYDEQSLHLSPYTINNPPDLSPYTMNNLPPLTLYDEQSPTSHLIR